MFRLTIDETIEIASPPQVVFAVLTEMHRYGDWSTLLVFHGGAVQVGEKIQLEMKSPAANFRFNPTVTERVENLSFGWRQRTGLPGVFDGHHRFEITAIGPSTTRLRNVEVYSGLLVPVLGRTAMMREAPAGFRAFNDELRRRAEALHGVSSSR